MLIPGVCSIQILRLMNVICTRQESLEGHFRHAVQATTAHVSPLILKIAETVKAPHRGNDMKRLFSLSIAAAALLSLSATTYADEIAAPEKISLDEIESEESEQEEYDEPEEDELEDNEQEDISYPEYEPGWTTGIGFNLGIGPAIDMLDPCLGYSARVGLDLHAKYWGIGLEVTWNTVWSTASPSRPNHRRDFADKTSNSGLMLLIHGYLPTSDYFVMSLGAGIGLGARYEDFSDNPEEKRTSGMMDASWLARVQTGAKWLVTDCLTLGFDLELNLGNYWSKLPRWNSDDKLDISVGAILTFSYQLFLY